MITAVEEPLSEEFTKYLLFSDRRAGTFHAVLHQFSGPDKGGPHCHPASFRTHIIKGGYVERRYHYNRQTGRWAYDDLERNVGDSFIVQATDIHEIIALPMGECWTVTIPQEKVREWGFYRFEPGGIYYRQHDHPEWTRVN